MIDEKKHILDNPKNTKRLRYGFFGILVLLFAVEPFVHKHAYFSWEEWPGFYVIFGFASCVLLVLISKYILRPLVKRNEDYYD